MSEYSMIAERVHSPDHTVPITKALADGVITPEQYVKLRHAIVHGDDAISVSEIKQIVKKVRKKLTGTWLGKIWRKIMGFT